MEVWVLDELQHKINADAETIQKAPCDAFPVYIPYVS